MKRETSRLLQKIAVFLVVGQAMILAVGVILHQSYGLEFLPFMVAQMVCGLFAVSLGCVGIR